MNPSLRQAEPDYSNKWIEITSGPAGGRQDVLKKSLKAWTGELILPFANTLGQNLQAIPILCYHRVLPDSEEAGALTYAVTAKQFESHLDLLSTHGFQSLSLEELRCILLGTLTAPARAVVLTFDDGFADNYHIAWKIAARRGVKLNLFVITSIVGSQGPLNNKIDETLARASKFPELWRPVTWEELQEMQAEGVNIGLHGHTHRNLATLGRLELRNDIESALMLYGKHLNGKPNTFALPYGCVGQYSDEVLKMLKSYGFEMIFSTIAGRMLIHGRFAGSALRVIPRIIIRREYTLESLERRLAGILDWIEPVQNFRQAVWEGAAWFRKQFSSSPL